MEIVRAGGNVGNQRLTTPGGCAHASGNMLHFNKFCRV